jgi:hypothetical protein
MHYNLEEIDLSDVTNLYLLRGLRDDSEKPCMGALLIVDKKRRCHIKLWRRPEDELRLFSKSDMEDLGNYVFNIMGLQLICAEALKPDFDRFWAKIPSQKFEIRKRD